MINTLQTKCVIVGRIRQNIRVDGRDLWTLFDSGARHSYIARDAATHLATQPLKTPRKTLLGGQSHFVKDTCLIQAEIEDHPLEFQASVIDKTGEDEEGKPIDVLFGAIAMQLWGIRLDPQNEALDFSHFTRDFVEF